MTNWVTIASDYGGRPRTAADWFAQIIGMLTKLFEKHEFAWVKGS